MRTFGIGLALSLIVAACAHAQVPIANPGDRLAWAQCAKDLQAANADTYRAYDENGVSIVPALFGVTCSGTDAAVTCASVSETPWQCLVTLTESNVGRFRTLSVSLTASDGVTESLKSTPLQFQWAPLPTSTPQNLKILKKS